ncbi:MAG: alpha-amylase family glycosyl hydrolase [Candidatus Thermoplasmatota archaeon]
MDHLEWLNQGAIYHILIDRFAGFHSTRNWDQPEFLGGTLRGIIDRLPYLLDLGVTTLWISPFYKTSAYHGYHITDFYQVDPRFGTLEDLQELIRQSHHHHLHIIADFVPNHCSKHHPFFTAAQQEKNSKYADWFTFTDWPDQYLCFLSVKDIPKLNLDNPETRDHIVNAAKYWLSLGFDGFRLDHAIGPSHRFWEHFTREIKKQFPHSVLIGEAWMMGIKRHELRTLRVRQKHLKWLWGDTSDSLFREYIGTLDGVLDFRVQELIRHYLIQRTLSEHTFRKHLDNHYARFPEQYVLPTFLDNHDMDRFLFQAGNNKETLKTAAALQFSLPHPAIIYYGTETGMTQTTSQWKIPANGDLQARQPMNWDAPDQDLILFYKQLIKKRI